jgi:hypothetical protein
MYSEWMHVDCRLALNNFRDYGGQHGQESEGKEDKEDKEGWQEEEVIVRRKPHSIRMTSEVRYAFAARTGGSFADRISAQRNVRPDPYADGCCITVRFFIGTRSSGRR